MKNLKLITLTMFSTTVRPWPAARGLRNKRTHTHTHTRTYTRTNKQTNEQINKQLIKQTQTYLFPHDSLAKVVVWRGHFGEKRLEPPAQVGLAEVRWNVDLQQDAVLRLQVQRLYDLLIAEPPVEEEGFERIWTAKLWVTTICYVSKGGINVKIKYVWYVLCEWV